MGKKIKKKNNLKTLGERFDKVTSVVASSLTHTGTEYDLRGNEKRE